MPHTVHIDYDHTLVFTIRHLSARTRTASLREVAPTKGRALDAFNAMLIVI
jgi:hypothetical protein